MQASRQAKMVLLGLVTSLVTCIASAGEDVEIRTIEVRNGIYMLSGQGGNIGVSTGPDGAFMIDDQFAPLTPKIRAAVRDLADEPGGGDIRFVLNTHLHGDHTGGNENLGKSGSLIVAHENVRKRMSTEAFLASLRENGASDPRMALPVVTFNDRISFHINGLTLRGEHFPNAHTDGDTVIWFDGANVVHMGDTFFNIGFPFIDLSNGGSFAGVLDAVDSVLAQADDDTRIIPGHGKLTDRQGLREYRDMLVTARDRIARLKHAGKSLEAVIAADPLADMRARWDWQFIDADRFVRTIYPEIE